MVPGHDRTTLQGKVVVVSVNRVGMEYGEAAKRTGLNGTIFSTLFRFLIYHGESWYLKFLSW